MDFAFTPEQEAFRDEVDEFFRRELTPEVLAEIETEIAAGNIRCPLLEKKLVATGWLTMQWPVELGGQGRSNIEAAIFNEAVGYYNIPDGLWGMTVGIVGNAIRAFGTEEQKQRYLPWIATGEVIFCQGFTEPEAGSDLASLQTRAVADGDDFVISGQKVFIGRAHLADYIYLATRTDPDAPKHRGLTLFLVDLKSPGVEIRPLWLMNGIRYNQLFFDEVRVPRSSMLGELNRGWYHMTTTLDIERSGTRSVGERRRLLEKLTQYIKTTVRNGRLLADDPMVRARLARLMIDSEAARLLSYRIAWLQSTGVIPNHETSIASLWNRLLTQRFANEGLRILGPAGQIQRGAPSAAADGTFEQALRSQLTSLHAGGTVEVQRQVIAQRGLGLPR